MKIIKHNLDPVYDQNSKILILGSFPSVKSREYGFYYMHPTNRFWKIIETIYNEKIENKRDFLIKHNIALWDVVKSCEINASSDASINCLEVNDINYILNNSKINKIYTTGKKSYELYNKFVLKKTNVKAIYLPSPSCANARVNFETIVEKYKVINK